MNTKTKPRRLAAGERVRFTPGGPLYEIVRVSSCAAYRRRVYSPGERTAAFHDRKGATHAFDVKFGKVEAGISPYTPVYREASEAKAE